MPAHHTSIGNTPNGLGGRGETQISDVVIKLSASRIQPAIANLDVVALNYFEFGFGETGHQEKVMARRVRCREEVQRIPLCY